MSCNYADGLSPYEDKGVLGLPEKFEDEESVRNKCELLAKWIREARHTVVHTGAGISTSTGIPDFRGPNGVWTLEKEGRKPNTNVSFNEASPTKTHLALKQLIESSYVHYIISQNIDGLHLRSGVKREFLSELHGNMFVEQCSSCKRQFIRQSVTTTVGKKFTGSDCRRSFANNRSCRGKLQDTILDWEDNLPEMDLRMADYHSCVADLSICLGTTLQIVPSGNLPLKTKKFGGKLVIINLQPTKHDKKADLIINSFVDDVLVSITKRLGLEIPPYCVENDPAKVQYSGNANAEWDFEKKHFAHIKQLYDIYCKNYKKRKLEDKKKFNIEIKSSV